MECHTPVVNGRHDNKQLGKGGAGVQGPVGRGGVAQHHLASQDKGIGDWTDAEIKAAITQGKRKDGSPLKPPMGYPLYARMTDQDLTAVVAYLRTVPAKE